MACDQQWVGGSVGPGFFLYFPSAVAPTITVHTTSQLQTDDAVIMNRPGVVDDEEAIVLALLELEL